MKMLRDTLQKILTNRSFLAIIFVVVGIIVIGVYSVRSYRAYQQWQYIREQGLDRGQASIEAIAPWMTVRYVSVAYAVPQEYIFAELGIPYNRRNSNETIGRLTREYLGRPERGERRDPILVDQIGQIILAYRQNPVATGLNDVRRWMTIQYIANSTGVPAEHIFAELDIVATPEDSNKPLDRLAGDVQFPGGDRRFVDAIETILANYQTDSGEDSP